MTEPERALSIRSWLGRLVLHPGGHLTAGSLVLVYTGFLLLPQALRGDDATRGVMLTQLADGIKPDSKYSFIQPVVSLPPYLALDRLGAGIYATTLLPLVWLGVWCSVVWRLLARVRGPVFAHHAVVLSVASLLSAYVVGFSSDVFTALAMSGGAAAGLIGRARPGRVAGWMVFAIGAANTPVMVLPTTVLALWLVVRRRQLRFAALPLVVFCVLTIESTLVTGELSWTRYSAGVEHGEVPLLPWGDVTAFGWPLWSGVLAVLFAFGRGVFFFIPQLWNGPTRGRSDDVIELERSIWVMGLVMVPLYASWWAWFGGVSFGPRFFLILVVPAAIAGAGVVCRTRSTLRSVVALAALVASAWVAIVGAIFGVTTVAFDWCAAPGGSFGNFVLCLYTPEYSALFVPLWAAPPIGRRHAYFAVVMLLLVTPTLIAVLHPLRGIPRRLIADSRTHIRGRWSI